MASFLVPQLRLVEERFDLEKGTRWMQANWSLSIYANAVYIAVIFLGRRWMRDRKPYSLRKPLALWNTGLAVFSMLGFFRLYPGLSAGIWEQGFTYSVCNARLLLAPSSLLWALLFVLSKVVEFGDTIFIVLRKTPLNFLHWYHHVSVFIYCAFSVAHVDPMAEFFGTANLFVHSVMYSYYVLKSCGVRVPGIVAKAITMLQLAQFVLGLAVISVAFHQKWHGMSCDANYNVIWAGVILYGSYFILFSNFFYQRYLKPRE